MMHHAPPPSVAGIVQKQYAPRDGYRGERVSGFVRTRYPIPDTRYPSLGAVDPLDGPPYRYMGAPPVALDTDYVQLGATWYGFALQFDPVAAPPANPPAWPPTPSQSWPPPATLNTYYTQIQGQWYSLRLDILPLALQPGPTPPPPPPPSMTMQITSVLSSQRQSVTSAFDNTAAFVEGSGFGAKVGSVTVAGLPAAVSAWADTEIAVTLPTLPAQFGLQQIGTVVVTAGPVTATSPFSFTLTSSQPPPPPPGPGDPIITAYLGPGRVPLAMPPTVPRGSVLFIEGAHFLRTPGRMQYQGKNVTVLSWSDSELALYVPFFIPAGPFTPLTLNLSDGRAFSLATAITVR
jgi:hypothetical protein